jgi:NADH-quinone oxidoreductase subunit L
MILSLLILFPLLGFLINGLHELWEKKLRKPSKVPGIIASGCLFLSFICAIILAIQSNFPMEVQLWKWLQFDYLNITFGLSIDRLSILFTLLITGVGFLIHIYSIGYMKHDLCVRRYFAFLNLFCAFMLLLVLGSNLLVLFIGWEGVGLCSYFLINYWYLEPKNNDASQKAFIMNRVGDIGFLIGTFLLVVGFGTIDFVMLQQKVVLSSQHWVIAPACFFLFLACTSKSAQIPLYTWLPDAMAAPTTVSALIHAATMVTSGIYLLNRLSFLFNFAPPILLLIACIGCATALLGGCIALVQTDIKKILAYSTVSQLGYMFMACGVGMYHEGLFHVLTHGIFKALLFLAAGSIIHSLDGEQDLRMMGGLAQKLPKVFIVFIIGACSLIGLPPFSGFFSKDAILWSVFQFGSIGKFLWVLSLLTAFITACYMGRLIEAAFFKTYRGTKKIHAVEFLLIGPLWLLALGSILIGLLGIPHYNWLENFLKDFYFAHHLQEQDGVLELGLMLLNTIVAILGLYVGIKKYPYSFKSASSQWGSVLTTLLDRIYVKMFSEYVLKFFYQMDILFENKFRSFLFERLGYWIKDYTQYLQKIHSGSIAFYVVFFVLGLVACSGVFIYVLV